VKAEMEGFAGCGDFEKGFLRTACCQCGDELRVLFSCEGRGSRFLDPACGSGCRRRRPCTSVTRCPWAATGLRRALVSVHVPLCEAKCLDLGKGNLHDSCE